MTHRRTAAPARLGRLAGALVGAMLAMLSTAAAEAACGDRLPAAHRQLAEAGGLQVAFAAQPAPLPLGRHFALDIVVCALDGQALPATLAVDAHMPAHRHGMNYRATVTALGDGRFRADGLMFHMAGRWRISFDLPDVAGAPPRRATRELDLR